MEQELHVSGTDGVRFFVDLCQPSRTGDRKVALAFLNTSQLRLSMTDAVASLRGKPGAQGSQFSGLKVEAAIDELDAGGQSRGESLPMCACESLRHFFSGIVGCGVDHPARAACKRHSTRREVFSAAQQQQALDGRLLHRAIG